MLRLRPLALLLALVLALCLLALWRTRSQTGGLRRVTTTSDEGININPSISGDGQHIAFESTEDLAHAGGSDHFRALRADLASDPAVFTQLGGTRSPAPGISRDGSRIAFAAKEDPLGTNPDGNSEIFYFDGATLRQITNTKPNDPSTRITDGNFQPSLTDDGRFIAFASNRNLAGQNADGNLEIFIYDTVSNAFTQLTDTLGTTGATDAKISGDGTRIAYIRDNGATASTQRDLILQDRTGGTTRVLASGVTNIAFTYGRAISDDGSRVVYAADIAPSSSQVFLFDGRTTNAARQITSLGVRATDVPLHPTISGDGTRLAFATRRPVTGLSNTDNSIELYTFDIPTGSFARVTNAPSTADGFSGSTQLTEVVSSLNDDGSIVAFNFPRVISGPVTSGMENNSEIYVTATAARPTTGSLTVLNGASFGNEPATTKAIAPNSIAVALGGALSFTTVQAQKQPDGSFPTTLGGTTVTVNNRAAQIFFVSPTQVNFLVPAQTEIGTATVVVTNSEGFQSRGTVAVLRAAPGIFTTSGDGTGEATVLNADTLDAGPFDPSSGNLRLIIFTTGVRAAQQVTATAGGRALSVESYMASHDMAGLDEVHVLVPSDLRGAGTVNLVVTADGRDSNPATIVFSGDACRDIVINELLADPPDGLAGDANHDGVRSGTDDEFVELVNTTASNLDISGYQLLTRSSTATSDTVRHTFPSGTLFPAGSAIVIFGGGSFDPNNPAFGGAQVFKASSGGLSLSNTGGSVTLRQPSGAITNIFTYGGSTGLNGDSNQSLTRSPDAGGGTCGQFVLHSTAQGSGGRLFSPGTRVDGSPFALGVGRLSSITISPASTSVTAGQTTQFTAQARDQFNRPLTNVTITFASDNTSAATVDAVSTDPSTGIATATVTGRSVGTAHITAQATDGTTIVTSSQATLTVNAPPATVSRVDVSPAAPTINRGQTQQFTATAFDQNNQPIANASFTWSSSNTNVATVNANGLATGVGLGAATITATIIDATGATVSGTATLTVQIPLVINEILADPPDGLDGDSNRDGVRDSDDDEFIELVNNSSAAVDVSGVIVADSTSNRFTFPANTTLAAGRAVVIFGGGSPNTTDPAFGGALIFTTSTLSLGNTGDTVNVKLPVGGTDVQIASQTYGAEGNDNQSLTRTPDLTGAFAKHSTAANSDGRLFSPGTRDDGTPFGSPAITRIAITPSSAAVNVGQTQLFTAHAFSNASGMEVEVQNVSFVWDSSDPSKATVSPATGQTTTATALASGTTTIRARAGGQQGTSSLTVNPTLSINDVTANEGNSGTTTFTFTVSLSTPAPTGGVTFNIATQDNTATVADNDYAARSLTSQIIPAGSQTYTFDVTVNGDVNIEPNETFFVNVTNVNGASIADGQGVGTILNDDSPNLTINDVSANEGNAGTTTFTFTVSSSLPAPAGGITFDIATQDGTATAGSDYVARSLTAQTIPAGSQTYTFDVTVNGDTTVEADETFFVNVTNVAGATVTKGQGVGTILNDDKQLVVISQVYGGGGNSGATYKNDFIEIFNRGTATVDLVGWSVQQAAATGTSWSVTPLCPTGSCLLAPGKYFLVQEASSGAVGNSLPTPDATGTINLSATAAKVALVSNSTALTGSGCPFAASVIDFVGYGTTDCFEGANHAPAASNTTAAIRKSGGCTDTDNNAADFLAATPFPRNSSSPANSCTAGTPPNLSINDVTVTEGNSGTKTATFTVSLSAPAPSTDVTFNIATQDNTATTANSDYVARSLTNQVIPAGQQTYTFDVTINGDTTVEPDETFFVNVTNVTGANVTKGQGVGTIQNDDLPALSINDVTKNEGNSGTTTFTFTVSLSTPAPTGGVTFDIATQDNTATVADNDYAARSLTGQTIAAGNQTYTFDVAVNGDTNVEPTETFFVNVTNVVGATVTKGQGTGTIQNDDSSPSATVASVSVSPQTSTINRGNTQQFAATALDFNNQPVAGATFTWSSSNTNVATIDANGLATGVGIGSVTITATTSDGAGGTVSGTATLNVQVPLVINEINADVAPDNAATTDVVEGDANRDGVRSASDDEFVELVNNSNAAVDLSGVVITDATNAASARFTFPAGTTLAAGRAVVVFGGGNPPVNDPAFGGALILTTANSATSSSTLSLNDTGDTVTVKLNVGGTDVQIAQVVYGGAGNAVAPSDQSLTRSPDADAGITGGSFVAHTSASNSAGRSFSPGTRDDGTPFGSPAITRIEVTPASPSINVGQTQSFTARAFSNVGGPEVEVQNVSFIWDSSDTSKATVAPTTGASTTAKGLAGGTPTIRARAGGMEGTTTLTVVAPPALTISDVTQSEGDSGTTTFTFTVSLDKPALSGGVTFDIATQDNTATVADGDYVARSLTAQTIAAGQQTYSFDVTVNGDTKIEPDETFFVNVTNVSGATVTKSQGIGTIQNDDSPSLSISDVTQSEGNAGTTTFTFTVSLTQPAPAGGVTFDIATQDNTATVAGNDYAAKSLTGQTITAGNQTYTFDVTVNGDTLVEPDETFFVNVTNVTGATVSKSQGVGTIQNDDTANLVVSQIYPGGGLTNATYANDFIEIFNRGTTTVDFSVTPFSVQFLSTSGSAWAKTDLATKTIAPGQYFLIEESGGATGAALPTPDATGNINVTSTTPGKVALVSGTTLLTGSCPGDDGNPPLNPVSNTIADFVGYGGTASTTSHCYEGNGPATFQSGNNTIADFRKNGGCTDTNDNAADFLSSTPFPRNSSSPTNSCTAGTPPDLSINDVTVTEGNSGTVTATFTVHLSAPAPSTDVTFDIATQDNTATVANNDYAAKSQTSQVIPAGQQNYTFSVTVNGDTTVEPDETFFVNVTNVIGANVTKGQGVGTIQNDDLPSLSINDVSKSEGNSGPTTFTFTVQLSAPAPAAVTFDIATQDNTATVADNDYAARSLTAQTIAAGQQSYSFDVTVNGDTKIEPDETFFVNVANVAGATVAKSQGTGTILNDDSPILSINNVQMNEGNSGTTTFTFTVSLSPASNQTVTVNYATADGTATTAGNDYQSTSGTLTFSPGDTTKTIDVLVNGDTLVEPDETFLVKLSSAAGASIGTTQGTGTIQNDDAPNLVISQVYGGGNNGGATYQNDFIELFNRGTTTVDFSITPYSVQYAGATSAFGASNTKTDITSGTIAPGHYFLIQESGGTTNGAALPAPDLSGGNINLAATAGKVALVAGTTAVSATTCPGDDGNPPFNPNSATIVDFVGYGSSANCYEGTGPTSAPSNTNADFRKSGGCTDTNDNAADFLVAAPNPRNTAAATNSCGGGTTPNLSINDVSMSEGNSGTTTFNFTVSLSTATTSDVTFDIATQDGTATVADNDYVAQSLTGQVIPAGQTTYTFAVSVNGDTKFEPDETFNVNVTNVVGATVVKSQGVGTIKNDDAAPLPSLSINDVSVAEGNSGTTTLNFTVSLSSPAPAGGVTFDIATADGTATVADSDYVAQSLTSQSIPAGQQTYTFGVVINGDKKVEPNETFNVNITNVTNATVSKSQGVGTILNDDGIVISQIYGAGGNSGATLKNDFIELFNRSTTTIDVSAWSVQYVSATATSGSYSVTNLCASTTAGTCTIAPGHYYLVKLGGGANGTTDLPTADATGTTDMSATAGKVAVVINRTALSASSCQATSTSVVDYVGYGSTANCSEGTPTAAPGTTTSVQRKSNGCQDTDSNNADFATASPNPRNSASTPNLCP